MIILITYEFFSGGVVVFAVNSLLYLNQSVPPYGVSLNCQTNGTTAFPLRKHVLKTIQFNSVYLYSARSQKMRERGECSKQLEKVSLSLGKIDTVVWFCSGSWGVLCSAFGWDDVIQKLDRKNHSVLFTAHWCRASYTIRNDENALSLTWIQLPAVFTQTLLEGLTEYSPGNHRDGLTHYSFSHAAQLGKRWRSSEFQCMCESSQRL